MSCERDIESVIETIRNTRNGCALLIGAGVSVKAGIPLAAGFVDRIRQKFPAACRRAKKQTYPHCMAQLTQAERHDFISVAVSQAKVNWAHVALAQLIREGHITRVLTTNFDPLVMRACALAGVYPAIYDLAASSDFKPSFVSEPAIFHLHGQHSGFVQLHTEVEVKKHFDRLRPVFADAGSCRPWIVVGYSGDNDPVFDHLAGVGHFEHGLYWIGFRNSDPPEHVRGRLLDKGKDAFYVRGFDADTFFVKVARDLGIFPPAFIAKPFSHLKDCLGELTPFDLGDSQGPNVVDLSRAKLDEAIRRFEGQGDVGRLLAGTLTGAPDPAEGESASDDTSLTRAWSLVMDANVLLERASKTISPEESSRLFEEIYGRYARAIEIQPSMVEAYHNWGVALGQEASVRSDSVKEALLKAACEKFMLAAEMAPNDHQPLYNWAVALGRLADGSQGAEKDSLLEASSKRYQCVVAMKPDEFEGWSNWGATIFRQAEGKTGQERETLLSAACDKLERALQIKPDAAEVWFNWGVALGQQAEGKRGTEEEALLRAACEKYARAIERKPDMHEAWSNWGTALSRRADGKDGDEKESMLREACVRYARAVKIKPDEYMVWSNWGTSLGRQAEGKSGNEVEALLREACDKHARAIQIRPDLYDAWNNWGTALDRQASGKDGSERETLLKAACEKYERASTIKPEENSAWRNWGIALDLQAKGKTGEEKVALLKVACEKYEKAVEAKPDDDVAWHNWGNDILELAKEPADARDPSHFLSAREKCLRAEQIRKGSGAYNLACISALMEAVEDCRTWLTVARETGTLPTADHLSHDSDLDSVRALPWFADFVGGQPQGGSDRG